MLAWRVRELGVPQDVLKLEEVPDPSAGEGEVVVAVEAAALNFADSLMCQGKYQERPEPPFTPGFEVAGIVEQVGGGVTSVVVGDPVLASTSAPHGGLAQKALVAVNHVLPVPPGMTFVSAAGLRATYHTAHLALHRRARLEAGETVLVQAGAGGVGSASVQVAKAAGATVIATAGGPVKTEICRSLGADHVIDYEATSSIAEAVNDITGKQGVDIVVDTVGGSRFEDLCRSLRFEGRLVVVGFAAGEIPTVRVNRLLLRNISLLGLYAGRYRDMRPDAVRETHRDLTDLYARGLIDPLIDRVVNLEHVPEGLRRLATRTTTGKVVVRVGIRERA